MVMMKMHLENIIIAYGIRYIGKESNNLEGNLIGFEDPDYLEYTRDHEIVRSRD